MSIMTGCPSVYVNPARMLACPLTDTLAESVQSAPLVRGSVTLAWNGAIALAVPLVDVALPFREQLAVHDTDAFCAGWAVTATATDSGIRTDSAR
jgi:hypothetical protein